MLYKYNWQSLALLLIIIKLIIIKYVFYKIILKIFAKYCLFAF